jgi:tungstate transport system ATP-binding protein
VTSTSNIAASLSGVSLRLGQVTALADLNLTLAHGERLALVGANGSGKSSLLRVLHGLYQPQQGAAWRNPALRQAMVFQRPYMMRASARSNVALGLWLHGMRWSEARTHAAAALERVGLAAVAERNAASLSGGQQQRLALGRAWSLQPDVLLLDEPTSSLDPHAKNEVESVMAGFAQAGTTLVFASHNLGQVKRLATRVLYLEGGRLLADLPVHQFFDRDVLPRHSPHADLFVRGELI